MHTDLVYIYTFEAHTKNTHNTEGVGQSLISQATPSLIVNTKGISNSNYTRIALSMSKPQNFRQKLFIFVPIFVLLFFVILDFSLWPKPHFNGPHKPQNEPSVIKNGKWFDLIEKEFEGRKIKVGLVNINYSQRDGYKMHGLAETIPVHFDRVSDDKKWEDFFPTWIDEYHKWGIPKCPEIPMPRLEDYQDINVIVARVPCEGWTENKGIRDVFRLQVNLVVANLAVASGWLKPDIDQMVYIVFIGSCGPMQEIFRCEDLLRQEGDYWVYKPELRRLKQMLLMPVGSCQIAAPYGETGRYLLKSTTYDQRVAYVTVLHSSEAYVCGAIVLAQSIIQSNSSKDLVLLHDGSIGPKSLRGLRDAGWKTKHIQRIRSPFSKKNSYNEWNYSKLRVWQLTEYDKVIFIDADLLVLNNIDEFFLYPQLSAAPNGGLLFNSGIMLIEPSMCKFEDLLLKSLKVASYNGGDQGFLNEVFTWWHRWPSRLNFLKYFVTPGNGTHEIPDNLHVIHYLGFKPWMCYRDYDCNWDKMENHLFASDSANRVWWQAYDAMPKRLQQYCAVRKDIDARIRELRRIAKNASLPDGHWKIEVRDPRQHHLVE